MFRSLLSACSVVVLVLPTLLFPTTARACPVELPETLLSLYRKSDAIFLARFDKLDDTEILEDSAEETVVNVRMEFDVSSALKGETRKLFVLEERVYRYKPDPSQPQSYEPEEDEENDEGDALYRRPNLKPGDTVLLFLKEQQNPDGTVTLGLTDYRDAIKKMSSERLNAYEARIRELNSIFDGKNNADDAKILDWLIRATQDPLTRWEGAFELQQSYQAMQWQESRKQEAEEEKKEEAEASGETAVASETDESEAVELADEYSAEAPFDNSVYARLLTDAQKETLMSILVETANEQTGVANPKKSISEADQVLIELVSNWGGSRLAKVLVDKMQREGENSYAIYRLMTTAVKVLGDPELEKIAEEYSGLYYHDGDSFVDSEDEENDESDEEEAPMDDGQDAVVNENSDDADKPLSDEAEAADQAEDAADSPRRFTYGELRAELLSKFVARSMIAINNSEAKEAAKAVAKDNAAPMDGRPIQGRSSLQLIAVTPQTR